MIVKTSRNRLESNPNWNGGRYVSSGYVFIRIAKNEYRQEHVLLAEKALGRPLPPAAEVHHVDERRGNNTPSNLVICENREYHKLLHRRRRVLLAGGDPNTQKICSGQCRQVLPFSAFGRSVKHPLGLSPFCRQCVVARNKGKWKAGKCSDCGAACDRDGRRCRSCWRISRVPRSVIRA